MKRLAVDGSQRDPTSCRETRAPGVETSFCALHMTPEDVRLLHQLLAEQETLLSVVRFHTGLVMLSHAPKWLAGIAGAVAVLKGFDLW